MSAGKRYAILAGLAVVLAAGGLVAYFSGDSRAKEKPAARPATRRSRRGPRATDAPVAEAIGNVEA